MHIPSMLVVFDVEGVLYDAEYLPMLARLVGKEREVMEITLRGIRGEIPWEEGLLRRIDVMRGIEYEKAMQIANSMPVMKGAREVCSYLKRMGFRIVAVSGGFTIITDRLKDELALDYVAANELIFRDGRLVGVDIQVDSRKANAIAKIIREWGVKKEHITAVVDGANDLTLFDIAGLRVAFNAQNIVKERADVVIDEKDLSLLIGVIERHYSAMIKR
ncbi:MAG: phosphoserine phosphatase SerB [Candidatus Nitrosocaldus sp.]|nr:phosphoserine phosphatase SerB [Candidatus Nitrosocaldus sp.]MDW8275563.1 phosphoserine phosphatase SerB [Candidatus Nitrosocaldus sp.]